MLSKIKLLYLQVRERENQHVPAAPVQPGIARPREKSARDILGMNRHRCEVQGPALSIEAEVDLYLADPCIEDYSLQYWTVRHCYKFPFPTCDSSICRTIGSSFPGSIQLLWTLHQFKHQVCHASEFSHQERKQWHLEDVASNQH